MDVPSLAGKVWVAWVCGNKAFSCPISILPEGGPVWSWFQARESTSQAAMPTGAEAAQSLLGPRVSTGLIEN